jgi:hypothetical protein
MQTITHDREIRIALEKLVSALVSPECPDAHIPALFAGKPGSGDIIPALLHARKVMRR